VSILLYIRDEIK